jgi:low affinity Fe/Cu permease
MSEQKEKGLVYRIGCQVSAWVADAFAHPLAQIGIILFCATWWILKLPTDILTAALSILAITLTQMVLNNQNERELDSHRRDVAMHAKLDELIAAKKGARNDFVGMEEKDEEEIVQLKEEVKEALEDADEASDPQERAKAHQVAEEASEQLKEEVGRHHKKPARKKAAAKA